jgi:hypothetical protein
MLGRVVGLGDAFRVEGAGQFLLSHQLLFEDEFAERFAAGGGFFGDLGRLRVAE